MVLHLIKFYHRQMHFNFTLLVSLRSNTNNGTNGFGKFRL